MHRIDVSYNPYLLKTKVLFDGEKPGVGNNLDEFCSKRLDTWINKMPKIFYDEMNGFGFVVSFSGTERDYKKMKEAFAKEGISNDDVAFEMNKKLEGPVEKKNRIYDLNEWLINNPNHRFDYMSFMNSNEELFVKPYSCIVINYSSKEKICLAEELIDVDRVTHAGNIESLNVENRPVLFFLPLQAISLCKSIVNCLYYDNTINEEQLFFCVQREADIIKVRRKLLEIGIRNPQVVKDINDSSIEEYFLSYTLSDYVYKFLKKIRESSKSVNTRLKNYDVEFQIKNQEIYNDIQIANIEIESLERVKEIFKLSEELEEEFEYDVAIRKLSDRVLNWNKKTVKSTDEKKAHSMAKEYALDIKKYFGDFLMEVNNITKDIKNRVDNVFYNRYCTADVDIEYNPITCFNNPNVSFDIKDLSSEFMQLKVEKVVPEKPGILDFLGGNPERIYMTPVTIYYYDDWRQYAENYIKKVVKGVIETHIEELSKYYNSLCQEYCQHIDGLLMDRKTKVDNLQSIKNEINSKYQIDLDWIKRFDNHIELIERG